MQDTDYNFGDRLLHRIALSMPFIGEASLGMDSLFARKDLDITTQKHVFVSGLARSGTTILLRALHHSGKFRSLTYRDMPFVLMPNLWKKLSKSSYKEEILTERAHGDGILVGYDSPEAFEEIFWRTLAGKEYIGKKSLLLHTVDADTIKQFRSYVNQIVSSADTVTNRYLSKNNNNILRLPALKKAFPKALLIIPFRDPLQHAHSLLLQHTKFCKKHADDSFSLDYMNWLGHYEFGLNHKPMLFTGNDAADTKYKPDNLNYWLQRWIDAYDYLKDNAPDDSIFICFEDVCKTPAAKLQPVFEKAQLPFNESAINSLYKIPVAKEVMPTDDNLADRAWEIYTALR